MSKYKWMDIEESELRKIYKLKEISEIIVNDLESEVNLDLKGIIKLSSWKAVYTLIKFIKCNEAIDEGAVITQDKSPIFTSEKHELAFYILNYEKGFDTELGITKRHYVDKEKAKEWRNKYIKMFHPDKNKDFDKCSEITENINKMYKRMVGEA